MSKVLMCGSEVHALFKPYFPKGEIVFVEKLSEILTAESGLEHYIGYNNNKDLMDTLFEESFPAIYRWLE